MQEYAKLFFICSQIVALLFITPHLVEGTSSSEAEKSEMIPPKTTDFEQMLSPEMDSSDMMDMNDNDEKRAQWNNLHGGWGKRAEWNKLSAAWGKRPSGGPGGNWNNLSGMWGKRAPKWNELSGMWGKRGWNDMSGAWGKRESPHWNKLRGMWAPSIVM